MTNFERHRIHKTKAVHETIQFERTKPYFFYSFSFSPSTFCILVAFCYSIVVVVNLIQSEMFRAWLLCVSAV